MTKESVLFEGSVQHVKSEWIDYNGHLNMAFYNVLFDKCVDEAFDVYGLGPQYLEENNASFFTLQAQVTYLAELKEGDAVRSNLRIVDVDEKRVHCFQELFHADEGYLSATAETMSMHIDMAQKKASPFPKEVFDRLSMALKTHSEAPVSKYLGQKIGIRRK